MERFINFGAGPAMLPDEVLQQIREELYCLPGVGISALEVGHRSSAFGKILEETRELLYEIVGVPNSHEVLFLQGGSRLQFSTVPLNFAVAEKTAAYVVTGTWSKMAFEEAGRLAATRDVWNGADRNFAELPGPDQIDWNADWSYGYFASNETIHGVQFRPLPSSRSVPMVCDMSSDFLSRPFSIGDFALVFACAQKNAGIAGLTIVIVDREKLLDVRPGTPGYLNLKSHIGSDNLYNTPPTFAIYVLKLMLLWIRKTFGDLAGVERHGLAKAGLIYEAIDRHPECYRGHATRSARSMSNATFFLRNESETSRFLGGAAERGMTGLTGHRSLGGVRASLYNALPLSGAQLLADYMDSFAKSG